MTRAPVHIARSRRRAPQDEHGVVLVQVAVLLVAIVGFCALAVDYGVLWVARAQAQNAADAAALAGATALAFDSVADPSIAEQAAIAAAGQNMIWSEPATSVDIEFPFPSCTVPGLPSPPLTAITCNTVSVHRDGTAGSTPLPTFFSRVVGVTEQTVRAQATASMAPANTTTCLWPVAIPDRWAELNPMPDTWQPTSTFIKYDAVGPPTPAVPADVYTPPGWTLPGSGFSINLGKLNDDVTLTLTPASFATPIAAGQFVPVAVPRLDGGGSLSNLASCGGAQVSIGDALALDGGATMEQVTSAASTRVAADPAASWNGTILRIQNSCSFGAPPCEVVSPRLVALPVFDVNVYEDTRRSGTPSISIVNIVGFFISSVTETSIVGHLSTYPGQVVPEAPAVGYISSFLRSVVLLR